MNYRETLEYLYTKVPSFQKVGKAGYKEGLENTLALDAHLQHPHRFFKTIHVAGTNGKGSCSHTLAAVLQKAGYKVGLYTSPHLLDFRERIRVDGKMASEQFVIDFVERHKAFFEPLNPSFFEITTAMAFLYFKQQNVDVAVIEVGLGGRLDCTNIIRPVLSIITNISFDHMQYLGNTLEQIACEKAGIIKPGVPVVVGETTAETRPVFQKKAQQEGAPLTLAEVCQPVLDFKIDFQGTGIDYKTKDFGEFKGELGGLCQEKNTATILCAVTQLIKSGFQISRSNIADGFAEVCELTGLRGRWQKIQASPTVICDTGHNEGGFRYIVRQLQAQECQTLRIVFGMVSDKDISAVLQQLPKNAVYYFTNALIKRALPASQLKEKASAFGLHGEAFNSVGEAYRQALADADPKDFIYVGGSSYVVADFLPCLQ